MQAGLEASDGQALVMATNSENVGCFFAGREKA